MNDREPHSLSLVVPLFREEVRLAEAAESLVSFVAGYGPGSEIVFVDDGSDDGTVGVVERLAARQGAVPIRLLRRPHRGKGASVRAGLRVAAGDVAAFCDVDLSTPPDQLALVIERAATTGGLSIGSRDVDGAVIVAAQSAQREWMGKLYNRILRSTIVHDVRDTQCGAKAASRDVWRRLLEHSREDGFAWDVEIVVIAQRLGIKLEEVPIVWRHDGRSRVRPMTDGARLVSALPRIAARTRSVQRASETPVVLDEVFDQTRGGTLVDSDAEHWWFRAKASIVRSVIARHLGSTRGALVDVGAGSGGVTAQIGEAWDLALAAEPSPALAGVAGACKLVHALVAHGDRLALRSGTATVVTLLDVIEHLDAPVATLREARRVVLDDGVVVVTVPAHRWMWSRADEMLGHRRRYTRDMLRDELDAAGFEVVEASHVFSWLVLPAYLRRRTGGDDSQLGLDQAGPWHDRIARVLTRAEVSVIRRRSLPLGTTIVAVARPRQLTSDTPPGSRPA